MVVRLLHRAKRYDEHDVLAVHRDEVVDGRGLAAVVQRLDGHIDECDEVALGSVEQV